MEFTDKLVIVITIFFSLVIVMEIGSLFYSCI